MVQIFIHLSMLHGCVYHQHLFLKIRNRYGCVYCWNSKLRYYTNLVHISHHFSTQYSNMYCTQCLTIYFLKALQINLMSHYYRAFHREVKRCSQHNKEYIPVEHPYVLHLGKERHLWINPLSKGIYVLSVIQIQDPLIKR